jgi:hypothetical protein
MHRPPLHRSLRSALLNGSASHRKANRDVHAVRVTAWQRRFSCGLRHRQQRQTGIFRGNGSTENADVRGRVEGDLVVHNRLLIRASGHVSGTITYGEIEIEAGGKISGVIQAHERPKGLGIRRS